MDKKNAILNLFNVSKRAIENYEQQLTAKDARIEGLIQNIRDMKYWAESGYLTQTIKIADEALQHKE